MSSDEISQFAQLFSICCFIPRIESRSLASIACLLTPPLAPVVTTRSRTRSSVALFWAEA